MTPTERRLAWLATQACAHEGCGATDRLVPQLPPERGQNFWAVGEIRLVQALATLKALCWEHHYAALCARRGVQRAQHGSRSMYRRGCRCAACHDIERAYKADRYVRKTTRKSPTGRTMGGTP